MARLNAAYRHFWTPLRSFSYQHVGGTRVYILQSLRPSSTIAAGNWVATGAATLHASTADDTDSSYASLTNANAPSTMSLALGSAQAPSSGGGTLYVRVQRV